MHKPPLAIKRHQDWPTRLGGYLQSQAHLPFAYGVNDCCLFVAGAVQAMTGVDLAADNFRGKYKTKISAHKALKRFGGGGLVSMMDEFVRRGYFEEVKPLYAGRGDVVLIVINGVESLGVVDLIGTHVVATGPDGVARLPLALAPRGWKLWRR